jgi:hypothetical protein
VGAMCKVPASPQIKPCAYIIHAMHTVHKTIEHIRICMYVCMSGNVDLQTYVPHAYLSGLVHDRSCVRRWVYLTVHVCVVGCT